VASYLKAYAEKFNLPVQLRTKVISVRFFNSKYEIFAGDDVITCDNLVVATGGHQVVKKPGFSNSFASTIFNIHSSEYKRADAIPPGKVLVVGAGASGVQIAIDLSKIHEVFLAGKPTFHIPDFVFRFLGGFYWWFISNVLTINTPMGRNARKSVLAGGGPLINVLMKEVESAGIKCMPRLTGAENGHPKFENGKIIPVSTIVWATGFKADFSWIDIPKITDESGFPNTYRGISKSCDQLYFVGMIFQFALTSAIIGGVGRDAEFIANHIGRNNSLKKTLLNDDSASG